MNSVGIIGFGRFGKILANILQKGFHIKVYDKKTKDSFHGIEYTSLNNIMNEKNIFIAVPIREFEKIINKISPLLKKGTTIIDVCSVKKYPTEIMIKKLNPDIGIIATHPMFGPDSFLSNNKLKMMLNNTRDVNQIFKYWKQYFKDQGIKVIEMTPDQHDLMAARTQGVTHFLGRMLKEFGIHKTQIDTQGFSDLLDLVDQTCNDTWELYSDLQLFNPYTSTMIKNLKSATDSLDNRLKELQNVEN